MPELPEVKTIADQLNKFMPFKITSITLSDVAASIVHTKMDKLKNKSITTIDRKGKMLNFLIDDGRHILSHLGMTGTWLVSPTKVTEKHTHVQLKGKNDKGDLFLAYVDPRRFGHMYLFDKEDANAKLNELGIDLLSSDFTYEYFKTSLLKYPARHIKVTLLDQSLFAGTGNYIANEICARGLVRPERKVQTLKEREIKKLYAAIRLVLDETIDSGGTTFQGGYRDTTGSVGGGVKHLVVFYQKVCQMCKEADVVKITLAQRGTYYCPKCQK